MAGSGLKNWLKELTVPVMRVVAEHAKGAYKTVKGWVVKSPAEKVKTNQEQLGKLEDWNLRRGNAEDAFKRDNPSATPEQIAAYLNADPALVSPKLPWSPLQRGIAAVAVVAAPFVTVAGESFISGAGGDPHALSPSMKTTPLFSVAADTIEIFGNSKANFATDLAIGAFAMGNDYRYDGASPEKRKEKGLKPSFERISDLSKTIAHGAMSTSAKDYVVSRAKSAASEREGAVAVASAAASAASAAGDQSIKEEYALKARDIGKIQAEKAQAEATKALEEERKKLAEQQALLQAQKNALTYQESLQIRTFTPTP